MSPHEIETLAAAIAERITSRIPGQVETDSLIDCHGVAKLLGCSVPTVERLTRSGELPSHKVGRLRRYRWAEILARQNEKGGPV